MNRIWSAADVPDLSGRVAVVTGANRGLGRAITRVLAGRGARVIMACRDTAAGEAAATELRAECAISPAGDAARPSPTGDPARPTAKGAPGHGAGCPDGVLEVRPLDLGNLASVEAF